MWPAVEGHAGSTDTIHQEHGEINSLRSNEHTRQTCVPTSSAFALFLLCAERNELLLCTLPPLVVPRGCFLLDVAMES